MNETETETGCDAAPTRPVPIPDVLRVEVLKSSAPGRRSRRASGCDLCHCSGREDLWGLAGGSTFELRLAASSTATIHNVSPLYSSPLRGCKAAPNAESALEERRVRASRTAPILAIPARSPNVRVGQIRPVALIYFAEIT